MQLFSSIYKILRIKYLYNIKYEYIYKNRVNILLFKKLIITL